VDYTRAPLRFRARKAARYVRLYGPRRTLVKVRGQYHMRAGTPRRAPRLRPGSSGAHVGVIGCGNFAFSHIAYYLSRNVGAVLRGAMDINEARAYSLAERYGLHYATSDASRVIEDPEIDLIYIASNHASHADYAIRALRAGKAVHVEKPHVVDDRQLLDLCTAVAETSGRIRLGFNRPESALGRQIRGLLEEQRGPMMLNWFVAGHEIARDHWYYRPEEGGRILGNLCHWTDFSLRMIDASQAFPVQITPVRARDPDSDIAISYVFADGSIAAITFSAKGHTFEGVRERFAAHRGELLLAMDDFQYLRSDVGGRKRRSRLVFRDHGHRDAILGSYAMSGRSAAAAPGAEVSYIWNTAQLFLRTREALENDRVVVLDEFDAACLRPSTSTA
jgi:predicted dehydrogenase